MKRIESMATTDPAPLRWSSCLSLYPFLALISPFSSKLCRPLWGR